MSHVCLKLGTTSTKIAENCVKGVVKMHPIIDLFMFFLFENHHKHNMLC